MRPWTAARTTAPLAVMIALCAAGCGKSDTQAAADSAAAASSSAAAAPAAAPAPTSPTLNDAQIAHVVVTVNSLDSAAGQLAKQKGGSKAVKDFGQTMVTDHGGVNKQAVALATKLKVTPEDNDVSRQLKSGGDQNMANLQGKSGAAFDSAYIDHEVTYHQAALDALDKTLIPGAQNAELKDLLQKSRPAFVAHLERAKKIQGELGKPSA